MGSPGVDKCRFILSNLFESWNYAYCFSGKGKNPGSPFSQYCPKIWSKKVPFQDLTIYLAYGNAAWDFPIDLSISLLSPIIFKNENMYIALVAGV